MRTEKKVTFPERVRDYAVRDETGLILLEEGRRSRFADTDKTGDKGGSDSGDAAQFA